MNDVVKGLLAGALGGAAGSYVMNLLPSPSEAKPLDDADVTVKTANQISSVLLNRDLTQEQKQWAGPAVHYAFGTISGAAYGALSEVSPAATFGFGLLFGTALWLAADEIAVPVSGLSGPPTDYPVSVHARALASHLVYGIAADLTRRLVKKAL